MNAGTPPYTPYGTHLKLTLIKREIIMKTLSIKAIKTNKTFKKVNKTVKSYLSTVKVESSTIRSQLVDATVETARATVATAEMATGTLLVTATATRMATQGIAKEMPKTKEAAEASILGALCLLETGIETAENSIKAQFNTKKEDTTDTQAVSVIGG